MAGEWLAVANKWGHQIGGVVNILAQWMSGFDDGDTASTWAPKVGAAGTTVAVTPTLTVAASYASGDFVGTSATAMTFANVARVAGGTVTLFPALLLDRAVQSIVTELWLFDSAPTPPNDSAAWSISDADAAKAVAVRTFNTWYASALNSLSLSAQNPLKVKCASGSKDLYGCLVTRGAPSYASGDLTITLRVQQD